MKPYFAKYVPVEEEIKEGDLYSCPHKGHALKIDGLPLAHPPKMVICEYGQGGALCPDCYKVKLFLCSRDFESGDRVQKSDSLSKYWDLESQNDVRIAKEQGFFKVIGEISPDATWVKEGDEFLGPEAGVKCEVFPIHDHDDETEEMIFTDKYGKKVDTPIYLIKGPCGHFH